MARIKKTTGPNHLTANTDGTFGAHFGHFTITFHRRRAGTILGQIRAGLERTRKHQTPRVPFAQGGVRVFLEPDQAERFAGLLEQIAWHPEPLR